MTIKKTAKQMSLAVGACSALAILAFGTSAFAQAEKSVPAAVPVQTSNIPRHYGIYKGDKIDVLNYQPTCPSFSIGMDAAAIQESASRAYVEAEDRRFKSIRDSWDAFEDCLTENARRDIEAVRQNLGDTISKAANDEATIFNAMNNAATANIDRISKLPAPKAPKPPRGDAAAAIAAPVSSTLSAWTTPTGRMVGSLSGPAQSPVYVSGCPQALGALTPEAFNNETSRAGFNALLDELRALPERINQVRACRQENGQEDYEAVQKAVTDGVNAVFVPRKTAFEREYAAVRFQLNEHRKPGGLLAAPEMGRAKPKAATKAKVKPR